MCTLLDKLSGCKPSQHSHLEGPISCFMKGWGPVMNHVLRYKILVQRTNGQSLPIGPLYRQFQARKVLTYSLKSLEKCAWVNGPKHPWKKGPNRRNRVFPDMDSNWPDVGFYVLPDMILLSNFSRTWQPESLISQVLFPILWGSFGRVLRISCIPNSQTQKH